MVLEDGSTKYMSQLTLMAYNFSSVRSHLCASLTTLVAPFPIATFWHTPYFFDKLVALSPALLRALPLTLTASASESDFREEVER